MLGGESQHEEDRVFLSSSWLIQDPLGSKVVVMVCSILKYDNGALKQALCTLHKGI